MNEDPDRPLPFPLREKFSMRIRELDGWRAISVLLVVLHHIGYFQYPDWFSKPAYLRRTLFFAGPLGVKTFFVISGFVICRLLILEERRRGYISLRGFYYRRAFRILPPFLIYLAATALLAYMGAIGQRWQDLIASALFIADTRLMGISWFLGHTWSLAVEEQFYLIFPGIWVLCRSGWREFVFAAVFLLCIFWSILESTYAPDALVHPGTTSGFASISCGVLIAIHEQRVRRLAARIPTFFGALVALVILIYPISGAGLTARAFDGLFTPAGLALIMMQSIERGGWFARFLRSRPMQAIGLTSYGIYLWQQLFTAPMESYSTSGAWIRFLLPLMCVIIPFSYFFVEKPAMNFGRYLSARGARPASAREQIVET